MIQINFYYASLGTKRWNKFIISKCVNLKVDYKFIISKCVNLKVDYKNIISKCGNQKFFSYIMIRKYNIKKCV